jgi:hypothetical protein
MPRGGALPEAAARFYQARGRRGTPPHGTSLQSNAGLKLRLTQRRKN